MILVKLSAQYRFHIALPTHNLTSEAGRINKITAFAAMLARGETIYQQRQSSYEGAAGSPAMTSLCRWCPNKPEDVMRTAMFQHSYASLPEQLFVHTDPSPVSAPRLLKLNENLAT